jgi:DNA-directed RNA polymerase beta' subunit
MSTYAKKPSKIIGIQFSLLSPEEIERNSVAEITNKETYNGMKPKIGGLFDPRMGVLEPGLVCPTDGENYINCPGYFGHIEYAKELAKLKRTTTSSLKNRQTSSQLQRKIDKLVSEMKKRMPVVGTTTTSSSNSIF